MQKSSHFPEMLPGMKQIDDLDSAGKVLVGIVPDPFGSISDDNLLFGTAPATSPGFQIDPVAELGSRFNCACIGRRSRIADGITFLIPGWAKWTGNRPTPAK